MQRCSIPRVTCLAAALDQVAHDCRVFVRLSLTREEERKEIFEDWLIESDFSTAAVIRLPATAHMLGNFGNVTFQQALDELSERCADAFAGVVHEE